MNALRTYQLTTPANKTFFAAVIPYQEGVAVVSTRNGGWEPETKLGLADLIMPEQDLADWEVKEVPIGTAPAMPGSDQEWDDKLDRALVLARPPRRRYAKNLDLPKEVQIALEDDAQTAYRLAYNSAVAEGRPEPDQAAWAAVEQGWEPVTGVWQRKRR